MSQPHSWKVDIMGSHVRVEVHTGPLRVSGIHAGLEFELTPEQAEKMGDALILAGRKVSQQAVAP